MAMFSIPSEHQKVIYELGTLDRSKQDALVNAMRDSIPSREMGSLVKHIADQSHVPEEQVADIVGLLNALYGVADYTGQTQESIIDDVIATIESKRYEDLSALEPEQIQSVGDFLHQTIVSNESLALSIKAQRMVLQYERVFLNSEIFTDLRTVFQVNDSDLNPAAAVLTHMLKIDYRQDSKSQTLHLALDSNDLFQLRETIDRAVRKQERLTELFSPGIKILELEREK